MNENERPATNDELRDLANKLEVSFDSLDRLGVTACDKGWLFPMRDASGEIVGQRLRYWKGGKAVVKGGNNGLFIPAETNPTFVTTITEGESDLAEALDLGLNAIGRPGATGCVDEAVEYLAPQRFNGITIIADRDENNAGLKGAEHVASALMLDGHIVRIVMPPDGFNDLRGWAASVALTPAGFHKHASESKALKPPDIPPGFFAIGNWQVRAGLIEAIGPTAFAILTVIASHYGKKDGLCRIGRGTIGELAGVSVSTVDKQIRRLKAAGVLEVVRRGHEGRCNIYKVHLAPHDWQKKGGWRA